MFVDSILLKGTILDYSNIRSSIKVTGTIWHSMNSSTGIECSTGTLYSSILSYLYLLITYINPETVTLIVIEVLNNYLYRIIMKAKNK